MLPMEATEYAIETQNKHMLKDVSCESRKIINGHVFNELHNKVIVADFCPENNEYVYDVSSTFMSFYLFLRTHRQTPDQY